MHSSGLHPRPWLHLTTAPCVRCEYTQHKSMRPPGVHERHMQLTLHICHVSSSVCTHRSHEHPGCFVLELVNQMMVKVISVCELTRTHTRTQIHRDTHTHTSVSCMPQKAGGFFCVRGGSGVNHAHESKRPATCLSGAEGARDASPMSAANQN